MESLGGLFILVLYFGGLWIAPIVVTNRMGKRKGHTYAWVWGALLGWIGVLIEWMRSDRPAVAHR